MQRVFGFRFWYLSVGGWLATAMGLAPLCYDYVHAWLIAVLSGSSLAALIPSLTVAAPMMTACLFAVVLGKVFWRSLWWLPWIGPCLSQRIFPDLNGLWDVELTSNWTRISELEAAARDTRVARYDSGKFDSVPLAAPIRLKAKIDQSWGHVSMIMWSEDPDAKIKSSRTIAFDLLRGPNREAEIAYFYEQVSKAENRESTDRDQFAGAAHLRVAEDGKTMSGYYSTARNWEAGLNTAGRVEFAKAR